MGLSASDKHLTSLRSVGPATIADLRILGITTLAQLRRADPERLFKRLCTKTGVKHDPCCRDVFAAAVAQAKDPNLPAEQHNWWYWSRIRKATKTSKR